ncbi:MAG: hypothetical protein ABIO02_00325 [Patescibacteria group bacterium]
MFEAHTPPAHEQKPHSKLRSCLTTGLLAGVIGLGGCAAITSTLVATNTSFDLKLGPIDMGLKKESAGYAGAEEFSMIYLVNNCFWTQNWQNGHLIGDTPVQTGLIFDKSYVVDLNPITCP